MGSCQNRKDLTRPSHIEKPTEPTTDRPHQPAVLDRNSDWDDDEMTDFMDSAIFVSKKISRSNSDTEPPTLKKMTFLGQPEDEVIEEE